MWLSDWHLCSVTSSLSMRLRMETVQKGLVTLEEDRRIRTIEQPHSDLVSHFLGRTHYFTSKILW